MARPKAVVYWDAMVWIAWLKNERSWSPSILDGIDECVKNAQDGKLVVVCGESIFKSEVLYNTFPPAAAQKLHDALRSRKAQLLDYDPKIPDLIADIRGYYVSQQGERVPTVPDAEHLAYALHYRVTEFWTMDDGQHGGRSLLKLNGNVAGRPLAIVEPHAQQSTIFGLL